MDLTGTRVALALGGGGARGCAHFGVIEELQARGADIVAVAGTSMGAVVGGVFAAGQLADYRAWMESLSHRDVLRLLDPSLRSPGLITAERVMSRVRDFVGDVAIEALPMPFTAVATELMSGKEVWFQQGPLVRAMRASVAIPSVITPLVDGAHVFVDGGLVDLVPVMPLASVEADLIVAVSLIGSPRGESAPTHPVAEDAVAQAERTAARVRDRDMLRRLLARVGWEADDSGVDDAADAPVAPSLRTVDIMEFSVQTMQRMITRYQLSGFPPDVLIELPTDICGTLDFHRTREMADLGRAKAAAILDAR